MNKLNKMLIRDIRKFKLQMLAVIIIIFVGITLFSACVMSYKNLQIFKDNFYSEYNFLDAYIDGINISDTDISKLNQISGIKATEGRLELEGFIPIKDKVNATAKIIAYKSQPSINKLKYVSGEYLRHNSHVLVSKNFAEYNNFKLNSNMKIKTLGKDLNLVVNGIVESPEFIITIKSRDYVMPSIKDYGIVYISYDLIKQNFNISNNSYNQVHIKLDKNANVKEVKKAIKESLGKKFIYFTQRKDQISEVMAREDIGMISEIAYMFPVMFLLAATLVIFVMQRKLIEIQRSTIGVLKAIGYKNSKIISYYLKQSFLLATIGTLLSIIPSYYLSIFITKIYCELVYIPVSNFYFDWQVIGSAIVLSNLFSLVATWITIKSILNINAAEAMRPVKTNNINENNPLMKIGKTYSSDNRMVLRNLIRNPVRSLFTIICYVIAFTLFSAPIFLNYSVNFAEYSQYEKIQKYDYKIVFNKSVSSKEIDKLIKKHSLNSYSIILEFPIEIEKGKKNKKLRIIGVDEKHTINDGRETHNIPKEGIILPKSIKEQLDLNIGENVEIKLLDQNDKTIGVPLKDCFEQYVGFSAYMNIEQLRAMIEGDAYANGIYINKDNDKFENVKHDIENNTLVKRIDSVKNERSEFRTLLNLVNVFIIVMILFGFLMGCSSIYNSTMINVIDRQREWGMLKVLGYSNGRILKISFKETVYCFLLSLIPSWLISIITSYILGVLMSNDFYTSPFVINYKILLYPAIFVILISSISVFIYYLSIVKINTSEVIKIKE